MQWRARTQYWRVFGDDSGGVSANVAAFKLAADSVCFEVRPKSLMQKVDVFRKDSEVKLPEATAEFSREYAIECSDPQVVGSTLGPAVLREIQRGHFSVECKDGWCLIYTQSASVRRIEFFRSAQRIAAMLGSSEQGSGI